MAAKKRTAKGEAAWTAQGERYLQKLLEDEDLRTSLLGAYTAARSAYGRLGNGKGSTHALFEDPDLQKELLEAAGALRNASSSLKDPSPPRARRRRRGGGMRAVFALAIGAVLALALSAELRSKVLDTLFGAEEQFDYTATSAPPAPTTAAV